jgi:hypothetical protein
MISQVTISITRNGEPREVWFLFETDHRDLSEFNSDLAADGTIFGQRINTEPAGVGMRREVSRHECIITRESIVTVIPSQYELLAPAPEDARP